MKKPLSKVLGEEILKNVFRREKPEDANQKREGSVPDLLYKILTLTVVIFLLHHFVDKDGKVVSGQVTRNLTIKGVTEAVLLGSS